MRDFAVLDIYRRHRELKPRSIAQSNEGGKKPAHVLAEEIVETADRLSEYE